MPTVVYDRGGEFDEAIGTPTEERLSDLAAEGLITLSRPSGEMLDVKFTQRGRQLLQALWDYNDRRAAQKNGSSSRAGGAGEMYLPKASTVTQLFSA